VAKAHTRQLDLARGDGRASAAQQLSDLYDARFYTMMTEMVKRKRSQQIKVAYEAGLAYLTALHEVEHTTSHLGSGSSKEVFEIIAHEHVDNKEKMIEAMELIQKKLPGLIHEFKRTHVASLLLHQQQEAIEAMAHHGQLLDLDWMPLKSKVQKMLKRLYLEPVIMRIKQFSRKMPTHYLVDPTVQIIRRFDSGKRLILRRNNVDGTPAAHHLRPAAQTVILARDNASRDKGGADAIAEASTKLKAASIAPAPVGGNARVEFAEPPP